MASEIPFTGERFVPGCAGEIAYEHWHRYAFARQFAKGKRALDAACGEGYGAALLGTIAEAVVGVDIDGASIEQAAARYAAATHVRFVEGSCTSLAFPASSFDVVVSFETIEHLDAGDQPRMLAEFARVLRPDGVLVISSPNKRLYSDARNYVNEFHRHELYREDLEKLLVASFPAQRWFHQRVAPWSEIWAEQGGGSADALLERAGGVEAYAPAEGMYFVVVAARSDAALDLIPGQSSIFTDEEGSEQKRNEANAREVLRLDSLLRDRDSALDRQSQHVLHLEALVAERERVVADMDRKLGEMHRALQAERQERETQLARGAAAISALEAEVAHVHVVLASEQERLDAAVTERERVIAYRQSARWWLKLPWVRLKLLFARSR